MPQTFCQQSTETEFLLANRFLKQHGQPTAGRGDLLFSIRTEQALIGATWLRQIDNHLWLRSLFIEPNYRHKGLATTLLGFIHQNAKQHAQSIFCLAKPELERFYLHNGYRQLEFSALPSALQTTFSPYLKQHPAWQIFTIEVL